MRTKSLFFISQYFYPENISTGQLLSELVGQLSAIGWKAKVLSAQPSYYERKRVDSKLFLPGTGVEICRVNTPTLNKNSITGKIVNYLSVTLMFAMRQLFLPQSSLVVTVTNPAIYPVFSAVVARIRKQRLVIIIHDVYPEIVAALDFMSAESLVYRTWLRADKWAQKSARACIVLGRDMHAVITRRHRRGSAPSLAVIPNWAKTSDFRSTRNDNPFLDEYSFLKKKFIVMYSGNMGLFHPIEALIQAAHVIQEYGNTDIHFAFVGGGGKLGSARSLSKKLGLQNTCFLPYQPKNRLKHSLGAADVGLVSLNVEVTGLAVPSKLYGLLAAGKPILANVPANCEVALVLHEEQCGLWCEPNDAQGIAQALMKYRSQPELMERHSHNALQAAEKRYSLDIAAQEYDRVFREIIE